MPKQKPFYAMIRVAIRRSIRAADWDVGMRHISASVLKWKKTRSAPGLRGCSEEESLCLYWRYVAIFGPSWTPKMGYPHQV